MSGMGNVPDVYESALDYLDIEKLFTLVIAVIFATPLSQMIAKTLADLEQRRL